MGHMPKKQVQNAQSRADRARGAARQGSGSKPDGYALNSYKGECELKLTIVISGLVGGSLHFVEQ